MINSRYRRITFFFARIILGIIFWDLILSRLGFRSVSRRTRPERFRKYAAQFRQLAIQMGGVMIKVGQFFSARVDVLPAEITAELSGLQDEVPPENFAQIRQLAESQLGGPLDEKFLSFDPVPMAAASLGQVHKARLRYPVEIDRLNNRVVVPKVVEAGPARAEPLVVEWREENVVVKIQRPDIANIITTDLAALRTVGNWIEKYPPVRRRADVPALLAEFTRTLYEEIDYVAEGKNAETFAANFKKVPGVRVPRVIWSHTTECVLTLEDVQSIKISDYEAITAAGVSRAEVAKRLLNTYLKQIFEDGFFHADPHPGNLFVYPIQGSSWRQGAVQNTPWQLTFVDFGMVGRVPDHLREGMRELLISIGIRDVQRTIHAFQLMGVLLPEADLGMIAEAETVAFDRFWGKSMKDLQAISYQEMRELTREYRELLYDLPFQVPEDLILLGRAIGILSGMCTGLDPQFNFWEAILPFVQKLVTEETMQQRSTWMEALVGVAQKAVQLPGRTEQMLEKMERGQLVVHDPRLTSEMHRLEKSIRLATAGILFAALLLGGVQLILGGLQGLGYALLALSALVFLWILWPK